MNPRALYGPRAALVAGLLAILLSACAGSPSRYPVPALPVSKLEQLRADALRALPPDETGEFLDTDLVEVVTLDPSLRLDVRYAGSDNFLRAPIYPEARVFLQRPAAEAVVRANRALQAHGYGCCCSTATGPGMSRGCSGRRRRPRSGTSWPTRRPAHVTTGAARST